MSSIRHNSNKKTGGQDAFKFGPNKSMSFHWEFDTKNRCFSWGAAITQWIRLRLPSCHPGFDSQADHLNFYHLLPNLCTICPCSVKRTKINKKEAWYDPFKKWVLQMSASSALVTLWINCLPGVFWQSSSTGVDSFFSVIFSYFWAFVLALRPCHGKTPCKKYIKM